MVKNYLQYNWDPVINFECGGELYYNKYLKNPTWPGGASGITIGIGADLGYMSISEFDKYFANFFSTPERARLKAVIGKKGSSAKQHVLKLKDIELNWMDAKKIFIAWTLPKF